MDHLSINGWEKFQHYKDRSPPWIKLHRDLLRDYKYSCLQDASKLLLMQLWLLASQLDNKIPNDVAWLKRQLPYDGKINLKPLIDSGYLLLDSNTLAGRKQSAIVETETETETETENKDISAAPESEPPAPPFIKIPIQGKKAFSVTAEHLTDFKAAYPRVDVEQELRALRSWNLSNPTRRKKPAGVMRHINIWLAKSQNQQTTNNRPRQSVADQVSQDASQLDHHIEVIQSEQKRIATR